MVIQIAVAINLHQLRGNDLSAAGNLFIPQFEYCFKFRELTGCEKKRSDKYKIMSTCFEVPFFLLCLLQGNRLKAVQSASAPVRKFSDLFSHVHVRGCMEERARYPNVI